MYRFRDMGKAVETTSEHLFRGLVQRAVARLVSGLNGRLAFPDLVSDDPNRPPLPIRGNLDAELVEVVATASGSEVPLEHSLEIIARNALLVEPGQPVIWGPGTTEAAKNVLYRTPYSPRAPIVVTYPFTARFLVFGTRKQELQR